MGRLPMSRLFTCATCRSGLLLPVVKSVNPQLCPRLVRTEVLAARMLASGVR
jgi:hypothetical protein